MAQSTHVCTPPHGAPLLVTCCSLEHISGMVLTTHDWLLPACFHCLLSALTTSIADGAGTVAFANGRSIDAVDVDPRSVLAADLDGDGDLDIIFASYVPDEVHWYENLDGKGTFSDAIVLSPCCDREGPRYGRPDW